MLACCIFVVVSFGVADCLCWWSTAVVRANGIAIGREIVYFLLMFIAVYNVLPVLLSDSVVKDYAFPKVYVA